MDMTADTKDLAVGLPNNIVVGSRFISEDNYGTVKYIGDVPPTKGLWLGVEWDDPKRGKHDGSRDGVQYFCCSSPTSGSFIRTKKADFGTDFLSSLRYRYVPDNVETADIDENDLFILGANNQVTMVEMVGAAEVAKRQRIIGEYTRQHACLVLEPLNLLPSWDVLGTLIGQFKLLKTLSVGENRLQIPPNPSSLSSSFSNLQDLFMNYMDLTWSMVANCACMWPRLKSLHVCYNQINTIDRLVPGTFESLELLNLEGNQIAEWRDIMHFSHLPKLERLILNANSLTNVLFEDIPPTNKTKHFSELSSLSLSNNLLNSWQDVTELEKLACLTDLKIAKNPFLQDMEVARVREQLVARLGGIKRCYNTAISFAERQWAELVYIKKYCKEWLASGGSRQPDKNHPSQEFLRLHPRFPKLLETYGIPDDSELVIKSNTLKDGLLTVTIQCPEDATKKVLTKKLPGTMEVQKVKSLIHKLLKLDVDAQKLAYTSKKVPGVEIKLDNDMRQLNYYSLESGDHILVRW